MTCKTLIATALLFALAGCGGMPPIANAPAIERAPMNELPLPQGVGPDGHYVYALGPLDSVSIEMDGMPETARQVAIDAQGMISYPLAGSVHAAGLTPTQLASALEERMRENYVRSPRVNVNFVAPLNTVMTPLGKAITVDGEVAEPGLYPVYRNMSLVEVVALAGGVTEFARSSTVLVFRDIDDKQYVGVYDLRAIRYGNYMDPQVYPGDRITVSESEARRLIQTLQPFMTLLTTPLIYLVRR